MTFEFSEVYNHELQLIDERVLNELKSDRKNVKVTFFRYDFSGLLSFSLFLYFLYYLDVGRIFMTRYITYSIQSLFIDNRRYII